MKNLTLLVFIALTSCSSQHSEHGTHDAWSGVGRIGEYDGGSEILNEGSDVQPEEDSIYACARVYLQIPYNVRDSGDAGTSVILSHQLWSVPVKKSSLANDNKWYAISTEFNIATPISNNVNFNDGEEAYGILVLEDGSIIYDQLIVPTSANTWQVCETLHCGQGGCQSHQSFDQSNWTCSITQNRINNSGNCPCIFNDAGYPYCDVHYGQETEE